MSEHSLVVKVPLDNTPERKEILERLGPQMAFALWKPTSEERAITNKALVDLGRKASQRINQVAIDSLDKYYPPPLSIEDIARDMRERLARQRARDSMTLEEMQKDIEEWLQGVGE